MVKELRCPDCDYVLVDKRGKDTDVLLLVESDELRDGAKIGICRKCGSIVFIKKEGLPLIEIESMSDSEQIFFLIAVAEILDKKGIYLGDIVDEFKKKETKSIRKTTEEINNNSIDFKKLFDSIERPITKKLEKIPNTNDDSLIDYKYILLSKGHDSWKMFNSKEELTKELSFINDLDNVLVYTLGKECKVERKISLV